MEALSRDELLRLFAEAREECPRDWLALLMAYWHGLRASELVGLTAHNIQDGFLTVHRLKGSLRTVQPLVEHAEPLLNERAAVLDSFLNFDQTQRLFPFSRFTFWRMIRKYGKAAGLPAHKLHPHILKHSIALHVIQKAGIENTRQYLGHKSISSTGAYLKVSDADASDAVKAALRS